MPTLTLVLPYSRCLSRKGFSSVNRPRVTEGVSFKSQTVHPWPTAIDQAPRKIRIANNEFH
jgi:hypothetical protein